ncbi:MAG: CRISPR-associated protein Csx15 [Chloroflexota bacterium]
MILLNFSHPITPEQQAQVEALTGQAVERVIYIPVQFDNQKPYLPQLADLMAGIPLSAQEWQGAPLLINLPAFNAIAALVLAELHGRMGYFPPVLRLRPVEGALPPRFEVAEVLNLQDVRDSARKSR